MSREPAKIELRGYRKGKAPPDDPYQIIIDYLKRYFISASGEAWQAVFDYYLVPALYDSGQVSEAELRKQGETAIANLQGQIHKIGYLTGAPLPNQPATHAEGSDRNGDATTQASDDSPNGTGTGLVEPGAGAFDLLANEDDEDETDNSDGT